MPATKLLAASDMPARSVALEINADALFEAAADVIVARHISTFPVATQDVALVVPQEIPADEVLAAMETVNAERQTTIVVVTHDNEVGARLGRAVTIRDGRVGSEGRAGRDYVVVGREGGLQLPDDVLDLLPPGSLVRTVRTPDGLLLQPVEDP